MRFVLVSKLCLACSYTKEIEQKLHYQYFIEQTRHHLVMEAQGEACGCEEDGECNCEYQNMGDTLMELELACDTCCGDEALISLIVNRWLVEERRHRKEVEEEAEELLNAKAKGERPKVARLNLRR